MYEKKTHNWLLDSTGLLHSFIRSYKKKPQRILFEKFL